MAVAPGLDRFCDAAAVTLLIWGTFTTFVSATVLSITMNSTVGTAGLTEMSSPKELSGNAAYSAQSVHDSATSCANCPGVYVAARAASMAVSQRSRLRSMMLAYCAILFIVHFPPRHRGPPKLGSPKVSNGPSQWSISLSHLQCSSEGVEPWVVLAQLAGRLAAGQLADATQAAVAVSVASTSRAGGAQSLALFGKFDVNRSRFVPDRLAFPVPGSATLA